MKKISEKTIEKLIKMTPIKLQNLYKVGDYLCIKGVDFKIVSYSIESIKGGQSRFVSYWSEICNLEINLDFAERSVEIVEPCIDWKRNGF